jgi:iron complex outermembrane receptor protein
MKILKLIAFFLLTATVTFAQQSGVKGTIKDVTTGDPLIGVNVVLSNGKGTVTDTAGKFFIPADSGSYTIQIAYIGYLTQTVKAVVKKSAPLTLAVSMESRTLSAVEVVADIAKTRETPIAFSNIDAKKIEEELASRDIPLLLNSTPGVYATQSGGGIGDSRITIRGFNQQNIGVLVDGIPVNDMENAQVYWSNWDGLGDITRNIQIQRGLGASKLAIASVGGTINIITRGLEAKKAISYSQEYGSDMLLKETLAMTTGRMKGDWGITVSGTRKTGNGWVDQTPLHEWAYFVKVEKRIKTHTISAGANAAPQSHGQRSFLQPINTYDANFGKNIGTTVSTTTPALNYGTAYNTHWGPIDRWTHGANAGDSIHNRSNLNERLNYFNKPLFNLSDYWTINDKLYLSTVLYASFGTGGGTSLNAAVPTLPNGQLNFQTIYNTNYTNPFLINPAISPTQHRSQDWIKSSINNHQWYGGLSTLTWKLNKEINLTAGLDMRWYKGSHYYQLYDMLGGDYILDNANANQTSNVKRLGDKYGRDYDGYVKYAGAFLQAEYVKEKMSSFVTLTGVETGYQRVDNFRLAVDTTKAQTLPARTPAEWYSGYGIKAGANYNLNEHHNVYVNAGYIVKAPPFNSVFDANNAVVPGVYNQKIASIELGYGFKSRMFAANVNTYYTDWKNKPLDFPGSYSPTTGPNAGETFSYNINGLNALHKGVELDFAFKPAKQVEIGGVVSYGDWKWNSKDTAHVYDANGNTVGKVGFDATGVHVGNTAQSQYGANIRYAPFKHFYVKAQATLFSRIYSNLDPTTLNSLNQYYNIHHGENHDSWRMPDYYTVDFHAGYTFRISHFDLNLAAHLLNAFNQEYISDANNGYNFNAATATVFFAQGRRFLLSMKVTFN